MTTSSNIITNAYKGSIISTIVDVFRCRPFYIVAYKGSIISTIVDSLQLPARSIAYKGSIISTIVDDKLSIEKILPIKAQ